MISNANPSKEQFFLVLSDSYCKPPKSSQNTTDNDEQTDDLPPLEEPAKNKRSDFNFDEWDGGF